MFLQWTGGTVWISSTCQELHGKYRNICTYTRINRNFREIVLLYMYLSLQPEELKFKDKIHVVKTVAQAVQVHCTCMPAWITYVQHVHLFISCDLMLDHGFDIHVLRIYQDNSQMSWRNLKSTVCPPPLPK